MTSIKLKVIFKITFLIIISNNLINMLTSEPANDNFDTVTTITNTTVLENQLRELLLLITTQTILDYLVGLKKTLIQKFGLVDLLG